LKKLFLLSYLIFSFGTALTQTFEWKWVNGANSSDISTGLAVAHTYDSNFVYIGGRSTNGGLNILGITLGATGTDGYVGKYTKNGVYQWVFGIFSNGWDEVTALDVDAAGNIYVGGAFEQTADFKGTSTGASVNKTSNGGTDVFVAKYNSVGLLQWVITGSSLTNDYIRDLKVVNNEVYVAGQYGSAFMVGTHLLTNSGSSDAFAMKLSTASGSLIWLNGAGSNAADAYNSVTVFGGNAYFGGYFSGSSLAFQGTVVVSSANASSGSNEGVLVKYNATNGALISHAMISGIGDQRITDMTNDGLKLYCTGTFEKTTTFPGMTSITEPHNEFFVARCSPTLSTDWLKWTVTTGSNLAFGNSIDIDSAGNLMACGNYKGSTTFLGSTFTSNGNEDILLVKLNPTNGLVIDVKSYGGNGSDFANSLHVNSMDRTYVTGTFKNTVNFTPISMTTTSNENSFWGAVGCIQGTATISGTTTLCSSTPAILTFNFTGPAPYYLTYTDGTNSFNLGPILTPSTTVNVAPASTTTYSISNFTANSCNSTFSGSATISVYSPIANNTIPSAPQFNCSTATPATLTGSLPTGGNGTYSYLWESKTLLSAWTNASGTNSAINYTPPLLTQTTVYRRRVLSVTCDTSYSSLDTIFVQTPITNNLIPVASQQVCTTTLPAAIVATAPSGGSGSYSYLWIKLTTSNPIWTSAGGATQNSISFSPGYLTETTYYRRIVYGSFCGSDTSNVHTVFVDQLNTNNTIAGANFRCYPLDNFLDGSLPIGGNNSYTYTWQYSGDGINFLDLAPSVTTQDNTLVNSYPVVYWYRRKVNSGACPPSFSDTVMMDVPITNNAISSSQFICSSTLANELVGPGPTTNAMPVSYVWQESFNGSTWSNALGSPNSGINFLPPYLSTTQYYRRIVTTPGCGNNSSNEVLIQVELPISNNVFISTNQLICSTSVSDTVLASNYSGGNGLNTIVWQDSVVGGTWTNAVGGLSDSTYLPSILSQTTFYRRIILDTICANDTSAIYTIQVELPISQNTIFGDTILCASTLLYTLNGLPGINGFSYSWEQTTDSTNASSWNSIIGATNQTYTIFNPVDSLFLRRIMHGFACPDVLSNVVEVKVASPIGNNFISNDTMVCYGTSPLNLIGSTIMGGIGTNEIIWESSMDGVLFDTAASVYNQNNYWTDTVSQTYFYRRRVINSTCPSQDSVSNQILVQVYTLSSAAFDNDKDSLCAGNSIDIPISMSGLAPYTFFMSYGTTYNSLSNITGTSYTLNYMPTNSLYFYLDSIGDGNGCVYSLADTFGIRLVDQPVTHLFSDTSICDSLMTINPNLSIGQVMFYSPSLGNLPTAFPVDVIAQNYGQHAVILTETNEFCFDSDTMNITFDRPIDTIFAGPDQTLAEEFQTQLSATALVGSESGIWSVASGSGLFSDPTNPNSTVEFLQDKFNYLVWTVSNGVCPMKSDTVVIEARLLFIPSGFSPNGDGANDVFVIDGAWNYPFVKLQVFNRWGNLVYHSYNYKNDWAGTAESGEKLPDDTYYFLVDVSDSEMYKGFLIIKR